MNALQQWVAVACSATCIACVHGALVPLSTLLIFAAFAPHLLLLFFLSCVPLSSFTSATCFTCSQLVPCVYFCACFLTRMLGEYSTLECDCCHKSLVAGAAFSPCTRSSEPRIARPFSCNSFKSNASEGSKTLSSFFLFFLKKKTS